MHVLDKYKKSVSKERQDWLNDYITKKVPRYLHERHDDIFQDVMIKLFRADERNGEAVVNYGYLKQTVMSVVIDYIRKYKVKGERQCELDVNKIALNADELSPETWANQQMILSQMFEIMATFDDEKQTCLSLYLRGLMIKEIAELTGHKLSKVRNHVYRGKHEIIGQLKSLGVCYEV